jgi:hypothetical protein
MARRMTGGPALRPSRVGGLGAAPDPSGRPPDLRLARIHLRTGSYALARAELETMAGAGALDDEALLDLAEIRWRTGDLPGAGEAATAYLASGAESVLGLVIAAEATAALGRPGEARRLAARALEAAKGPLEPLFAGLARSPIWPHDPADAGEPAGAFFSGQDGPSGARSEGVGTGWGRSVEGSGVETEDHARPPVTSAATGSPGAAPGATAAGEPPRPPLPGTLFAGQPSEALPASLWEAHPHSAIPAPPLPDGRAELEAARAALEGGDLSTAAVRLAVVLRVSPGLAPAVIDVLAAARGPEFDLIRGDAFRLVGHEAEAQRSYAAVTAALGDSAVAPAASLEPNEPDEGVAG